MSDYDEQEAALLAEQQTAMDGAPEDETSATTAATDAQPDESEAAATELDTSQAAAQQQRIVELRHESRPNSAAAALLLAQQPQLAALAAAAAAATTTASGSVNNTTNTASVTYNTTHINIAPPPSTTSIHAPSPGIPTSLSAYMPAAEAPLSASSLASFQSHALMGVQGLAASFGTIATVLAKDQALATREADNARRKLAGLQTQIDALTKSQRELAAQVAVNRNQNMNEKLRQAMSGNGSGGLSASASADVSLGEDPSMISMLLERLGRAETELSLQRERSRRERADLRTYFQSLQGQIRGQNQTCEQIIRAAQASGQISGPKAAAISSVATLGAKGKKPVAADTAAAAIIAPAFKELELPSSFLEDADDEAHEDDQGFTASEDSLTPVTSSFSAASSPRTSALSSPTAAAASGAASRGHTRGATTGSSTGLVVDPVMQTGLAMSPEVGLVLAQLLAECAESRATTQALSAMVLSASSGDKEAQQATFESALKSAREDQIARKDLARENLERAVTAAAANALAGRPLDPAQLLWQQQQEARTKYAIKLALGALPTGPTPSNTSHNNAATTAANATNISPSVIAVEDTLVNSLSKPLRQQQQQPPLPSTYPPIYQGFSAAAPLPAGARPLSSADLEAAATSAVSAAFAAYSASSSSSGAAAAIRSNPLLTAGTIAASMAAQAAQVAAKQAQDALASINFIRENSQFSAAAASSASSTATAPASSSSSATDSLFDLASPAGAAGSDPSRSLHSSLSSKRMLDKFREQDRLLGRLDSTVTSLSNAMADLSRTSGGASESQGGALRGLEGDLATMADQFASLARQFQTQHRTLDGRITQAKLEGDAAVQEVGQSLRELARKVDQKADLALLAEKTVSKSEFTAYVKRTKSALEDLAVGRGGGLVSQEDLRTSLDSLRETIQDHAGRERTTLAGRWSADLARLNDIVESRASRSDLLSLSNTVRDLPKLSEEVLRLKEFVRGELERATADIMSVAVDRPQLKRSLARMLKSLVSEVSAASVPQNCEACAIRTGVHTGTNCLSCAQQMKLHSRLGSFVSLMDAANGGGADSHLNDIVASRGGGFMVTAGAAAASAAAAASSAAISAPSTAAHAASYGLSTPVRLAKSSSSSSSSSSASRPSTTATVVAGGTPASGRRPGSSVSGGITHSGSASARSFSRTAVSNSEAGGGESFPPAPGSTPLSLSSPPAILAPLLAQPGGTAELGSDGRLYTHGRGHRTHRLVSTQRKSAARAAEEDGATGDAQGMQQWKEEKETATGSQSARTKR